MGKKLPDYKVSKSEQSKQSNPHLSAKMPKGTPALPKGKGK